MNTGAKIAIGCGAAVLLLGGAAVVGMVGLGYWAKGKAEQFVGGQKRIQELQRKADANPFTRPADGLIREDRLVKFLDVRKQVFAVYEQHKPELDEMSKKHSGSLSDVGAGIGIINELRLAHAQALADQGMSQEEYRFMVEQVYKTMWASEVARQNQGKSVSEVAGEAYEKGAEQMKKAEEEAEEQAASAAPGQSPEQREAAARAREQMGKGLQDLQKAAQGVRDQAKAMDVPPQNIALFRKYEPDIKKYAMNGLEWLNF